MGRRVVVGEAWDLQDHSDEAIEGARFRTDIGGLGSCTETILVVVLGCVQLCTNIQSTTATDNH